MAFSRVAPALALVALLLAGCGGSGGGGGSKARLSRSAVLDLLKKGVKQNSSIGGDRSARLRNAKAPSLLRSRAKARNHEDEDGSFWYSDWLELWIEQVVGTEADETGPTGERYWVDHEKTQPGGHMLHWVSASGVYPIVLKDELTLTAGAFAGEYELTEYQINEDETGSSKGRGTVPNEVEWTFTGSWDEHGHRTFDKRAEFADGSWQTYGVKDSEEDGKETVTIGTSQGVTYTLHNNGDFTGSGTITGEFEGLPATMEWDENGDGFITWSDGTKTAFNLYE